MDCLRVYQSEGIPEAFVARGAGCSRQRARELGSVVMSCLLCISKCTMSIKLLKS